MLKNFNGLSNVNIELTSRCNKSCWMCGRRKIEQEYPELAKWGDMDYEMVKSISEQIPLGVVTQFHDNGEPFLYLRLGETLNLFNHTIKCLDTNGKLLIEKADEIIDNLDTITISTFEGDGEAEEQLATVTEFAALKGDRKPRIIIRMLGDASYEDEYYAMGFPLVYRALHSPDGSYGYTKRPILPEIGICLEALHHLAIKRDGGVAMCVRFDPHREGIIGDLNTQSLEEIWNGIPRKLALQHHINGERKKIPLCRKCEYWGCPTS